MGSVAVVTAESTRSAGLAEALSANSPPRLITTKNILPSGCVHPLPIHCSAALLVSKGVGAAVVSSLGLLSGDHSTDEKSECSNRSNECFEVHGLKVCGDRSSDVFTISGSNGSRR